MAEKKGVSNSSAIDGEKKRRGSSTINKRARAFLDEKGKGRRRNYALEVEIR